MASSSKLMDKDEQLQLCIQRFVSDTQSMINQFSEVFIGELRRFADVCMEFSVAYRGVQEDRQFLTAENKSLKDELDARRAEVDFLGKELREIREENDELIRKLECLNINSEGEISMIIHHDSTRPRNYAVVNSMPAFPRRYSEAIGYDPPASSADHREISNQSGFNLSTEYSIPSTTSKNQLLLLTPPIAFNNNNNENKTSTLSPTNISGDEITSNTNTSRSHSRDEISKLYPDLLNDSNNEFMGTLSFGNTSSKNSDRSPSLDEMRGTEEHPKIIQMVYNQTDGLREQHALFMINSSVGTFYDCNNMSNIDNTNDVSELNSNQEKLHELTDQIRRMSSKPPTANTARSSVKSQLSIAMSPEVIVSGEDDDNSQPNTCAVVDVELKQLKKQYNETSQQLVTTSPSADECENTFIAKTPSPNCYNFNQHFDKYRCDSGNKLDCPAASPDGDLMDEQDAAFLQGIPPVQRYNSKKILKKRKTRKKTDDNQKSEDDIQHGETNNLLPVVLQNGINVPTPIMIMPISIDSVSIIPSPQIDLNRYLLVEVCHIISPSHFYLIVNDEKVGTNAFEDFLERFQNFYKSIEEIDINGFDESNVDDEECELRLLVSMPPPTQALSIGSYWACYIDEELDWRRVQVIERDTNRKSSEHDGEDFIMVKDVDSGYSSMVHSQMIRPLTDEMARVPAFAIRASLAFIYPHLNHYQDQNSREDNSTINGSKDLPAYYDEWPMECCQFFEDMTYDQILTASVLQIHRPYDDRHNCLNVIETEEVAHVLLWCTSAEDFEIFINRKLIELNYAGNMADDDSWMEQFSEVNNTVPDSPNIETCFNVHLAKPVETIATTATFSAPFQSDQQKQTNGVMKLLGTIATTNQQHETAEKFCNTKDQPQRKIKIKTRSKKKKGSLNEAKDEKEECQGSCSKARVALIQMIGVEENVNNEQQITTETVTSTTSSLSNHPNSLLHLSTEPKIQISLVTIQDNRSSGSLQNDNEMSSSKSQSKSSLFDQYCHTLHHDPRLSNWIIQKHSQHVTLKKTFSDKISYMFRVTCFFEPNKFIGILPFGERKLDLDLMYQFIRNSNESQSPFGQFVQEMTEFYQENIHSCPTSWPSSSLRLLPEQCIFEQANSSTIVFYESRLKLFLRGHIVGKDITPQDDDQQQQHEFNQSKSAKDLLKVPVDDEWANNNQPKKKTLSLKRRSLIRDAAVHYIIYAIDAGRYFQVPLKHIYHLDERFKMTKPFAIVCKLHGFPNTESSTIKLRKMVKDRFFGLRFIDMDFSTERFAVELFTFTILSDSDHKTISLKSCQSPPLTISNIINQL